MMWKCLKQSAWDTPCQTPPPAIAGHAKYITDSVEEVLEDILAGLDL